MGALIDTIPRWIPSVASAATLNTQDELEVVQGNTAAYGKVIPLCYGLQQVGGQVYAFHQNELTDIYTIGVLFCLGEIDGYQTTPILLDGEAPVDGVSVNLYTGTSGQGIDPLLQNALNNYSDQLVISNELGTVGVAHAVIQYSGEHYGNVPAILANIRGRKIYDPATQSAVFSSSPALILADVLRDPLVGYGEPVNDASLLALKNDNAELVGGAARREIGITFASASTTEQIVEVLRGYASCWAVQRGREWHFASDRPRSTDATYNASQMVQRSFKVGQADPRQIPTVIRLIYTDTSGDIWQERQITYPETLPVGQVRRESVVRMPGIQRFAHAYREAVERFNKLQHDENFIFVTFDEAISREVGDVIEITHPMGFTARKARVTSQPRQVSPGRFEIAALEYHDTDYSDLVPTEPPYNPQPNFFKTEVANTVIPQIAPVDGLAIKNSVGTLTLRIQQNGGFLSSGDYQLYVGNELVTTANGYAAGSNGYTGVFDAGDIDELVKVELKTSPTAEPIDAVALLDLQDSAGSILGVLSNPVHATNAAADGTDYDLSDANGTFVVYDGLDEVTGLATYQVVGGANEDGLTITIDSSGDYFVTGSNWDSDKVTFELRATYGGIQIDRFVTIVKARKGGDGASLANALAFGYGSLEKFDSGDVLVDSASGSSSIVFYEPLAYLGEKYIRIQGGADGGGVYLAEPTDRRPHIVAPGRRWILAAWIRTSGPTVGLQANLSMATDKAGAGEVLRSPIDDPISSANSTYRQMFWEFDLTGTTDGASFCEPRIYSDSGSTPKLAEDSHVYIDAIMLVDVTAAPHIGYQNADSYFPAFIEPSKGGEGVDGEDGNDGEDADPTYSWTAYADSADGTVNFTTGAAGDRSYTGTANNQLTETPGTDPAAYSWAKTRGDDGDEGDEGETGVTPPPLEFMNWISDDDGATWEPPATTQDTGLVHFYRGATSVGSYNIRATRSGGDITLSTLSSSGVTISYPANNGSSGNVRADITLTGEGARGIVIGNAIDIGDVGAGK